MDRSRAMKMAAAAFDGNDSCYLFESIIFSSQSSAHEAEYRTSKLRRGSGRRPRLTVMINRKDYYGRNCNQHFMFRRGCCGSASMCEWIFAGVFLHRAHYQRRSESGVSLPGATCAEGGVVVPHRARCPRRRGSGRTPRRRQVELPRLARPKGCFDTSAEWS